MNYENVIVVAFFVLLISCSDLEEKVEMSGNPLFNGEWYADPEIVVLSNKYWIFPTASKPFREQVYFDAFSSEDLIHWEKHENIIDSTMFSWADSCFWAPSVIEKEGKIFFFFGANDLQRPTSKWWNPNKHSLKDVGGIGIAVSENPDGPYMDYLGKPLIGEVFNKAQPIDQFIFKDNENYYIYFGGWRKCNVGILSDDFKSLIPFEHGSIFKDITPEGYVEGSVIFKRNEIYYMMWSEGNWTNDSYQVSYGMSVSPFGPFHKIDVVLQSDSSIATGAGHNSVLQIPNTDDWYIIYHRRPIPNTSPNHRVSCIDRMYFNDDGTIKPIKMTFEGVTARKLYQN